jgi:hypothetical protein
MRLMTGITWSPSLTASVPPGRKQFCTSTTINALEGALSCRRLDRAGARENRLRQRHTNKAKDYFTPLYPAHVFRPWIDILALRFSLPAIWDALRMPDLLHFTKYSAAFAAFFTPAAAQTFGRSRTFMPDKS